MRMEDCLKTSVISSISFGGAARLECPRLAPRPLAKPSSISPICDNLPTPPSAAFSTAVIKTIPPHDHLLRPFAQLVMMGEGGS
jgi:hypothetical protein